jgi:AbrB family looped-hinge helix DNA binding protein
MQVKVSKHGQLTIPLPLRQQLGIMPGMRLEIEARQGILQMSIIPDSEDKTMHVSGRGLAKYTGRRLEIEEMDPAAALDMTKE